MDSIAQQAPTRKVAIGVDTHKHLHLAVALDELGGRRADLTVSADSGGYALLEEWPPASGASSRSVSKAQAPTAPVSRATSVGEATG